MPKRKSQAYKAKRKRHHKRWLKKHPEYVIKRIKKWVENHPEDKEAWKQLEIHQKKYPHLFSKIN